MYVAQSKCEFDVSKIQWEERQKTVMEQMVITEGQEYIKYTSVWRISLWKRNTIKGKMNKQVKPVKMKAKLSG